VIAERIQSAPYFDLNYDPSASVDAIRAMLIKNCYSRYSESGKTVELDALQIPNLELYRPKMIANASDETNGFYAVNRTQRFQFPFFAPHDPPPLSYSLRVPKSILKFTIKQGDETVAAQQGVSFESVKMEEDRCSVTLTGCLSGDFVFITGRNAKRETLQSSGKSWSSWEGSKNTPDDSPVKAVQINSSKSFHGRVAEIDVYVVQQPQPLNIPFHPDLTKTLGTDPSENPLVRLADPRDGKPPEEMFLTPEQVAKLEVVRRKSSKSILFKVKGAKHYDLVKWNEVEVRYGDGDWESYSPRFVMTEYPVPRERKTGDSSPPEPLSEVRGIAEAGWYTRLETMSLTPDSSGKAVPLFSDAEKYGTITGTFDRNQMKLTWRPKDASFWQKEVFNKDGLIIRADSDSLYWGVPTRVDCTFFLDAETKEIPFAYKTPPPEKKEP